MIVTRRIAETLAGPRADQDFSAAAVLALRDGEIVCAHHEGTVRAWDSPAEPAGRPWPAVDASTLFDLASITKPLVAAAILEELARQGRDPALPVTRVLPDFGRGPADPTTVLDLLAHTAGLAPEWRPRPGGGDALAQFRRDARPLTTPGAAHRYSCTGYIWAGLLGAALAGLPLDALVRRNVLGPLGMTETGFRPAAPHGRIAATEFQDGRGLVHGEVHDEAACALGGVSGNAGLFGTAPDLARFAEALRREDGPLRPVVRAALLRPVVSAADGAYQQSAGLRIDEDWMRALGPGAVGHTGFTGTAFATRPGGRTSVVFLTNRVHPSRSTPVPTPLRTRIVELVAQEG